MKENEINNLLWTGGWDSTFRLLYLLLVRGEPVQPYYLIDTNRKSTNLELRTMREIKNHLFDKYPKVKDLLLPNIFKEVYDIKPNTIITESFNRLLQDYNWGTQYEWLARFTYESGIKNPELCFQKEEDSRYNYFLKYLIPAENNGDEYFTMNNKFDGTDIYAVFKNFKFPVLNHTKSDMQYISKTEGFNELMEITWFCHNPLSNDKPCGTCIPCIQVIHQGFGRRIPFYSRIRYYLGISRRIRNSLQKFPGLHNFLVNVKNRSQFAK